MGVPATGGRLPGVRPSGSVRPYLQVRAISDGRDALGQQVRQGAGRGAKSTWDAGRNRHGRPLSGKASCPVRPRPRPGSPATMRGHHRHARTPRWCPGLPSERSWSSRTSPAASRVHPDRCGNLTADAAVRRESARGPITPTGDRRLQTPSPLVNGLGQRHPTSGVRARHVPLQRVSLRVPAGQMGQCWAGRQVVRRGRMTRCRPGEAAAAHRRGQRRCHCRRAQARPTCPGRAHGHARPGGADDGNRRPHRPRHC